MCSRFGECNCFCVCTSVFRMIHNAGSHYPTGVVQNGAFPTAEITLRCVCVCVCVCVPVQVKKVPSEHVSLTE